MTQAVPPALVTDAHLRSSLAAVRALGSAGVPVLALGDRRSAAARWSRHAASRALGPPASDPAALVARIVQLAERHGPLVVMPGQERTVDALQRARSSLPEGVVVPYGEAAGLERVRDKAALDALGRESGLPAPRLLAAGTAAELAAAPPPAPAVLKSRDNGAGLPVPRLCDDDTTLRATLRDLAAASPDEHVVAQELVRGPLVAVSLVLDREGRVAARFQQRALRTAPAHAGASSLAVSVAPDADLVERAAALLRAAGFWGLAQLQLLVGADGPRVIDVNPRSYGSLPLALAAGVNLPAAWHAVATGRTPPPLAPYRAGVRYRWLSGELTAASQGARGHLRTGLRRPLTGAVWAADDPVPSLLWTAAWTREVLGRRVGAGA